MDRWFSGYGVGLGAEDRRFNPSLCDLLQVVKHTAAPDTRQYNLV